MLIIIQCQSQNIDVSVVFFFSFPVLGQLHEDIYVLTLKLLSGEKFPKRLKTVFFEEFNVQFSVEVLFKR